MEAQPKKHQISIIFQTSTLQDDGTYKVDGEKIINEGANVGPEYQFKRKFIRTALRKAQDEVVDAMEALESAGYASGINPEDIDWNDPAGSLGKKSRKK